MHESTVHLAHYSDSLSEAVTSLLDNEGVHICIITPFCVVGVKADSALTMEKKKHEYLRFGKRTSCYKCKIIVCIS
jgi:hypothetical protein